MSKYNTINIKGFLICLFTIIIIIISLKTNYPFLIDNNKFKTPTSTDVDNLMREYQFSQKQDEHLYLIYFDNSQDFKSFLGSYTPKLVFRGLEGVVVKMTSQKISEMINNFSYISSNNVHQIFNNERKHIIHTESNNNLSINPSVQTLASAEKIGVSNMWKMGYYGQNIKIGIFDTGVADNHTDFSFPNGTSRVISEIFVNTTYGNEYDGSLNPDFHGTHVAGIAAGGGILNQNYQGMANESIIYNADLDYNQEDGNLMDFTFLGEIAAINWAIENGVQIINKSYGDEAGIYWYLLFDPSFQATIATHRQAIKKGIIFTHSAGNTGPSEYTMSADNYIGEISVGSSTLAATGIPTFSSRGPIWGIDAVGPDILAPGQGIISCSVSGGYVSADGTSMAAPHVAGGIAVLLSALNDNNIDYNPGTIKTALMTTSNEITGYNTYAQGTGQINISAAFEYIMNAPSANNHPLIGVTNPRNLNFDYFPQILNGTDYLTHFTFISSECKNVTISTSGSIAPFLSFTEKLLVNSSNHLDFQNIDLTNNILPEYYSHDIILRIKVPDNTPVGHYDGTIDFKVNDTSLYNIPFAFDVKTGVKKVLIYTGNSAEYPFNFIGRFREMFLDMSANGYVLHLNETDINSDMLSNYDVLWMACGNRTYQHLEYDPDLDAIIVESKEKIFTSAKQEMVLQYLEAGGGVILSPYSTPLGIESLINEWGISTSEIPVSMSTAPCKLWHSNPIGKTFDFIQASGSFFSIDTPSIPLAYQNERKNIVMASYDHPFGGRVVVISGSDFVTNTNYLETDEDIHNDLLIKDIINWVTNDEQLFCLYKENGDTIDFKLHASINGSSINDAEIIASHTAVLKNTTDDITSNIPLIGINGWYNFTYTLIEQGIDKFNFSWNNEFISFELITDSSPPKLKFSGITNNSILSENTKIVFSFYDLESGINKHQVQMILDENQIGFQGPLENKTGIGYYIEKTLYVENYAPGQHVLRLIVQDIAGNSASINAVFIVEFNTTTKTSQKNSGLEWNLVIGLAIFCLIFSNKYLRKSSKR